MKRMYCNTLIIPTNESVQGAYRDHIHMGSEEYAHGLSERGRIEGLD